jgi:hypothetical protein
MRQDRLSSFGRPSNKRLDTATPGRTCAEDKCETVLSRYNKTERCGVHEPTHLVATTHRFKEKRSA